MQGVLHVYYEEFPADCRVASPTLSSTADPGYASLVPIPSEMMAIMYLCLL